MPHVDFGRVNETALDYEEVLVSNSACSWEHAGKRTKSFRLSCRSSGHEGSSEDESSDCVLEHVDALFRSK